MFHDALQKSSILYTNVTTGITVYSGRLQQVVPVAIKEQLHGTVEEANASVTEAMIQGQLDHPNVCKVFGCFLERAEGRGIKTVIVVELLEGDLFRQIRDRSLTRDYWSEDDLLWTLNSLSLALSYSQIKGIAHRDIKPQNIFLSSQKQVKLGDFGSSTLHLSPSAKDDSLQGTPFFLSPELKLKLAESMQGGNAKNLYDPYKSDVYSLGVTMLYMGSLQPPNSLMKASDPDTVEAVLQTLGSYDRLKSILRQMLSVSPDSRPSFAEIVQMCTSYFYPLASSSLHQGEPPIIDSEVGVSPVEADPTLPQQCCVCRHEVLDRSWTVEVTGNFLALSVHFNYFCSFPCLETYCKCRSTSLTHSCVHCSKEVTMGALKARESLLFPCAHAAHTFCFRDFLEKAALFVHCPLCNVPIPSDLIDLYTKKGFARELVLTKESSLCSICNVNTLFTSYGGCGHNICADCGFSQIQLLFKSPKCRVCYERMHCSKE